MRAHMAHTVHHTACAEGQGKYQQDAQKQRQCNALCLHAHGPPDVENRIILIYIGIFE